MKTDTMGVGGAVVGGAVVGAEMAKLVHYLGIANTSHIHYWLHVHKRAFTRFNSDCSADCCSMIPSESTCVHPSITHTH